MDRLQVPAVILVGRDAKTIGGDGAITTAMRTTCLARMMNFCKLAKLTITAEFPSFDTLVAFEVFDIPDDATISGDISASAGNQLQLLARVFGLNPDKLRRGFAFTRPIAVQKKHTLSELSNLSAWKAAIDHIGRARRFDSNVLTLLAALLRYGSWTASSCGVERTFSLFQWSLESRKAWLTDSLVNDELKIHSSHFWFAVPSRRGAQQSPSPSVR